MKTAINLISARLRERITLPGFSVRTFDATGALPPYVMLWAYPSTMSSEKAVTALAPATGDLYATVVAGTGLGVLDLVETVETVLLDGRPAARLETSTHRIDIGAMQQAQPVQPDRNTVIENTNQHPFYTVVSFPVTTQTIGEK